MFRIPAHKQRQGKHGKTAVADEDTKTEKRLLKPHVLSGRLTKLCDEGKLDEAVETLKNMPLDAQNVSVWNTLVSHAGRRNRFQLAYQLHTEMKRRGFKPDSRSFATLLGAFTKVPDWSERGKLLQNVHKAYKSFIEYTELVKSHNPNSPELSVIPINAYLTVLSKAGQWQQMFDVYNTMEDSGPLSPNAVTYTIMIKSFGARSQLQQGDDPEAQAARARNASDARLVWRQMTKRIENGADITIDSQIVDSIIQALALGRPADHVVAFDIIRDYVGFAKPGETAPPASVEISRVLLSDILWFCNVAKKHRVCIHWVQQLMDRDPNLLDHGHMEHALAAFGQLGAMGSLTEAPRALQSLEWMLEQEATGSQGFAIRPTLSTYTLVLVACWRGRDWDSTLRTFEFMTGYRGDDFADGATGTPQKTQRSKGRNIMPDAAAMSCIVRAAVASGEPEDMRQCVRIVRHFGVQTFLAPVEGAEDGSALQRNAQRFKKDTHYYAHKTASALVELIDELVPKKTDESPRLSAEEREWVAMRTEARAFLKAHKHHRPGPEATPALEEHPLGSAAGLAATDDAVAWERISREQKTSKPRSYLH
ncbi:hypothetical protein L226DRAFT_452414 [Lentinus tigrinus ALCF2SS1-7]|uniref:Pentacotripeptide-repeat region of PRORP domain-containing protein n=1 Tax=Lentinus tigrinus ALCF2SS1-6 TaxID=1328759 RepID=A0A5C2ST76_9APHY|nr:hypothetical protein L227DRAFT_492152 [Lentinus tigrinus ALCF2SS1-6]RPD81038.1 hypothetical protein L226DRAFT_452414 [Lentinus tigrinus ALCF2SS1-7]